MKNTAELVSKAIHRYDLQRLEHLLNDKSLNFNVDTHLDHKLSTPLHLATKLGHVAQVRLLLDKGANPGLKTRNGDTCLHLAAQSGIVELISKFYRKNPFDIDELNDTKQSPLHFAVRSGNREAVAFLLEHDADMDSQDEYGNTPLHEAVKTKSLKSAQILLEKSADPNVADNSGNTPFHRIFELGNDAATEFFMRYGADLQLKNGQGRNALHLAVSYNSCKIAEMLLTRGLDVNEQTNLKQTPLHLAVKMNSEDVEWMGSIIRILLLGGADVHVVDKYGRTALDYIMRQTDGMPVNGDYAMNRKLMRIAYHLMHRHNAVVNVDGKRMRVLEALDKRDVAAIRRLVDYIFPRISRWTTKRLLCKAVAMEDEKLRYAIVRFLLENGEDVDMRNEHGCTPLFLLVSKRELQLVKLFVELGADVNARNRGGESALSLAVKIDYYDAAKFLLENEAMVNCTLERQDLKKYGARSLESTTILARAVYRKNRDMVKLLLDYGANVDDCDAWRAIGRVGSVEIMKIFEESGGVFLTNSTNGVLLVSEANRLARSNLIEYLFTLRL